MHARSLLCLLLLLPLLAYVPDLYQTLKVPRSASESQIRKAFKDMSLKFHPDRNPDANSFDRYQQIVAAYEVLRDPERREWYDLTGRIDGGSSTKQTSRAENVQQKELDDLFESFSQGEMETGRHNQQGYEFRQYIDEFGRVRRVVVKKKRHLEDNSIGVFSHPLFIPVKMLMLFGGAYAIVACYSSQKKK